MIAAMTLVSVFAAPLISALFAAATIVIPPAQGEADAPLTPDQQEQQERDALPALYDELAASANASDAASIAEQIEIVWELSGSPTADLLNERALLALAAGDIDMATRHLDDALRFAPDYAEGWVRRAEFYAAAEQHGEALEALETALTADPRHFRALLTLAQTLERMESLEGAYEAYGEALKVHPFLEDALEKREELERQVRGRDL